MPPARDYQSKTHRDLLGQPMNIFIAPSPALHLPVPSYASVSSLGRISCSHRKFVLFRRTSVYRTLELCNVLSAISNTCQNSPAGRDLVSSKLVIWVRVDLELAVRAHSSSEADADMVCWHFFQHR